MASGEELSQVAERYVRFADIEANRSSPHCELLAGHVTRSAELLHFHMKLPFARRVVCAMTAPADNLRRRYRHGNS